MNLVLRLNGEEVLLFCGRIRNWDTDFNSGNLIAPPLLLKLFSLFNELVTDQGCNMEELPMLVTEKELWLMRHYVQPSDRVPGRSPLLGILLLRKLHALLLQANCEVDLEGEAQQSEVDVEAKIKNFEQWLEQKKEAESAATDSESGENADHNPAEKPGNKTI